MIHKGFSEGRSRADQQWAAGLGVDQQLQKGPVVWAASLKRTKIECDGGRSISMGLRVEQLPGTTVGWSEAAGMACSEKGQGSGERRDGGSFKGEVEWIATP